MGIELEFLNALQSLHMPLGDWLMVLVTTLGEAGIVWIVLTAVLLCIPKTRKTGLVVAAALLINLVLCNGMLKPLAARTRPFVLNPTIELLAMRPTDYSFPSGHTSASFAAAWALVLCRKEYGVGWLWKAALVLAVLIAFSRMYLYMHFPTDVLGGLAVGLLSGWIAWYGKGVIQKRRKVNE